MDISICDKCGIDNPSETIKIQYIIFKFCRECTKDLVKLFETNRRNAIKVAASTLLK